MAEERTPNDVVGNHATRTMLYAMLWFVEHPMYTNISSSIDLATQFMLSNSHLARDVATLEALGEARSALVDIWTRNRDSMIDALIADSGGELDSEREELTAFADAWMRECGREVCESIRKCLSSGGYGSSALRDGGDGE